jgi:hypothetical protein
MNQPQSSRHVGKSILAVLVGILAGVIPTLIADALLHKIGFFPPLGQPTPDTPLMAATAYRIVFSIFGSYVVARLAPNRPMLHALISGGIGVIVSTAGAIATWNSNLGAHWYPLALIVTALPCAWVGAKIRLKQLQNGNSAPESVAA